MKLKLITHSGESVVCRIANTFWTRFRGLMGQDPHPEGEALLIQPCNSIHMFGMRFPLDVVFLDRSFNVVKLIRNLAPNKVVGTVPGAWQVLEIEAGRLPMSISEGVRLDSREI